jgi:leader peptidase (prepilin peptidase)/N-methyltransferase
MDVWMQAVMPLLLAPAIGSFAALLAYRLPREQAVLVARSRCDSCGTPLRAADLVPLLSWLVLRGRCRSCGASIGVIPFLAEAAALAAAAWAVIALPPDLVWPGCGLAWLLLALALADARSMMLPDPLVLALGALGLGLAAVRGADPSIEAFLGALLGFAILSTALLAYRRLRGRAGLGWGDAKLLAAGGAWVGWQGIASVLLVATLATLTVAAWRGLGGARAIPFGPGLALGIWVVWLYGPFGLDQ